MAEMQSPAAPLVEAYFHGKRSRAFLLFFFLLPATKCRTLCAGTSPHQQASGFRIVIHPPHIFFLFFSLLAKQSGDQAYDLDNIESFSRQPPRSIVRRAQRRSRAMEP